MPEYFDVYDIHRNRTGKVLQRGETLGEGEYSLVIHLLLFDQHGRLLVQKRVPDKSGWPDMWDISLGGHAQAGENSAAAVAREAKEELGISLCFEDTAPVLSVRAEHVLNDYWFAEVNSDALELRLQAEEVAEVKWVSREEWLEMNAKRLVIPYSFHNELFDLFEAGFPGTRVFPFGNPPAVRAAVFDMDGLLLDTERVAANSWNKAAEAFHFADIERAKRGCLGLNLAGERAFFERNYGKEFPFEAFRAMTRKLSHEVLDVEVPVKEGAEQILQMLQHHGIALAVASSSRGTTVNDFLRRAGLLQYFDVVITGDTVEHSKPHPEIFSKACAALGVAPEYCLAFEDSINGIRSAYRAGMYPIQIPDLVPQNAECKALSWKCFSSLTRAAEWLETCGLFQKEGM